MVALETQNMENNGMNEDDKPIDSPSTIVRSGSIGSIFTTTAGATFPQAENRHGTVISSSSIGYNNTTSVHRQPTTATPTPSYRPTHQRTRSVDLRLSSASPGSGSASMAGHRQPKHQYRWLVRIEEEIAKLYYKHGLFCSRHPAIVILLSLVVVVLSSYQIITFRMVFGSSYDVYISSSRSDNNHRASSDNTKTLRHNPFIKHLNFWPDSYVRNAIDDDQDVPPWFQSNLSYAYVQQIIIRSAVIPWNEDMQLVDALRGPFDLIFDLVEAISNFQFQNNHGEDVTLNDVCFQVFEPTLAKQYAHIAANLPSYSCLMLSPANVWHGDRNRFQQDASLLTTLLKFQDIPASPVPSGAMHDILFGVQFEDTGIRRTYGRNRMRTITYGVTLILRKRSDQFVMALRNFLHRRYPVSKKEQYRDLDQDLMMMMEQEKTTKHVYYHKTFTYNYLVPLTLIYAVVCLYMYFSVRKMEIIRNKRLYSVCTLLTILMSLFLSFGICFRLKFHSVLIVNRLLPYFVAGISFENMLVLTKSVLAIPHLDSKVRVAQALSKEGLSITKNLLAEITLLSIGSFMFSPFFQECCKIAAVCFLSDFFIQITFFTPFFSLLIQRISVNERNQYSNVLDKSMSYPRNIYASGPPAEPIQQKTPKRLRFIYFLARLRLVQRCFILLLSACIGFAIYNAYMVLEQTTFHEPQNEMATYTATPKPNRKNDGEKETTPSGIVHDHTEDVRIPNREQSFMRMMQPAKTNETIMEETSETSSKMNNPYYNLLYTKDNPISRPFPYHHWTNLFSLYNISLVGRFISILPPITLSIPVLPERAKQIRNLADSDYHTLKKFIPIKFTNGEYVVSDDDDYDRFEEIARKRWSKEDIRLLIGLWIPSFVFFLYLVFQLYRCFCTRNYAEWRSELSQTNPMARFVEFVKSTAMATGIGDTGSRFDRLFKIDISMLNYDHEKEAYVDAKQYWFNNQDIDLIATNENTCLAATSSMSGDIRVYDSLTCESLATIKRSQTTRGNFCVYPKVPLPQEFDSDDDENDPDVPVAPNVARTRGELRTLFYGIGNDCDDIDSNETPEPDRSDMLDFRPIWCMDVFQRFILVGCGGDDGRFEVWDAYTGQLTYVYHSDSYKNGYELPEKKSSYAITAMKATYWGVALARINGQLEMLEVESPEKNLAGFSAGFVTPTRKQSTGKCDILRYRTKFRKQAHQQPIWRLEILDSSGDEEFIRVFGVKGCLISGSKDTTLKVFALDSFKLMYTLNGHCGAIVATALDPYATASALSGCQLGQLCVWDLNTGTCIFNMQAHNEAEILSITTSPLYYVSIGTDNVICVWDRYSGNLIHGIPQQRTICRDMVFLEPYILVTVSDGGELTIWDVNDARPICVVPLANTGADVDNGLDQDNKCIKSYQMSAVNHLVFSYQRKILICDYGNSLCIINNPFVEMRKRD